MNLQYFENLVSQKILGISTIYLAKVVSHTADSERCNIQPLSMIKAVGGTAKKQSILANVPISKVVLHALDGESLSERVVIAASCERDISQTKKGVFATPSFRHHSKSDSVIIGYL